MLYQSTFQSSAQEINPVIYGFMDQMIELLLFPYPSFPNHIIY